MWRPDVGSPRRGQGSGADSALASGLPSPGSETCSEPLCTFRMQRPKSWQRRRKGSPKGSGLAKCVTWGDGSLSRTQLTPPLPWRLLAI